MMRARIVEGAGGLVLLTLLGACTPSAPASSPALASGRDPTPLAKCRVAASASSPLVTEWPASEKAHLQGLAASQAVAVTYSGCELRIVDACRLPGKYTWRRTTLASDTLEITSADELWAKLPLGAVGLEGELERSGRLAVRTTVSGQMTLEGASAPPPGDGACAGVTHVVSGIAVGAFGLVSGGASGAKVGGSVAGIGASGATRREEQIVRQAGDARACGDATDQAPHAQCGAPIQLFLQPLAPRAATPAATASATGPAQRPIVDEARARETSVQVTFPAPTDRREHWTLREPTGGIACSLPCTRWVAPGSGLYLERSEGNGFGFARVEVPPRLAHPFGTQVNASYQAERGHPFLSTLTFYGLGVPAGALGATLVILGATNVGDTETHDRSAFFIGGGIMYLAVAAASTWWWLWSHPASLETREVGSARATKPSWTEGVLRF